MICLFQYIFISLFLSVQERQRRRSIQHSGAARRAQALVREVLLGWQAHVQARRRQAVALEFCLARRAQEILESAFDKCARF